MFHIEREIGQGPEMVYAYHFPFQYIHNSAYPMKIGHAKKDVIERIKEQQASMQQKPIVDLLIKCDHAFSVEKVIHNRLDSCKLLCFGNEWFSTTPEKILDIWWEIQDARNLSIGEQLRFFRSAKGMTQSDLAKAAGVRQETISNIETDSCSAKFQTVENLAKELGLRIVLTPD
jgi:DNA-binding XRE family transcriptional regulator